MTDCYTRKELSRSNREVVWACYDRQGRLLGTYIDWLSGARPTTTATAPPTTTPTRRCRQKLVWLAAVPGLVALVLEVARHV
jgi:hypothetical protein